VGTKQTDLQGKPCKTILMLLWNKNI